MTKVKMVFAFSALILMGLSLASNFYMKDKADQARDEALVAHKERAEALSRLAEAIATRERTVATLEALQRDQESSQKRSEVLQDQINKAPASDDGEVAPVLRRALDGVREP